MKKLETYSPTKIGKEPVVVVPMVLWQQIQDCLEDIQISASKKLARDIKKSRLQIKQGKIITLQDL